jgi:hypothetical protein
MDGALMSAAAALGGAVIGGILTLLSSWLIQRRAERAQWLSQDTLRRQELYKEFVEEASKCLVNALQSDKPDLALLVPMYHIIRSSYCGCRGRNQKNHRDLFRTLCGSYERKRARDA